MSVALRHARRLVAWILAHRVQVYAFHHKLGCRCVPQGAKTRVRDADSLEDPLGIESAAARAGYKLPIHRWLRCAAAEVPDNHLRFIHDRVDVIGPPLEHLLSLLGKLGNDVDSPYANCLVAQSLFNHIFVEAALC